MCVTVERFEIAKWRKLQNYSKQYKSGFNSFVWPRAFQQANNNSTFMLLHLHHFVISNLSTMTIWRSWAREIKQSTFESTRRVDSNKPKTSILWVVTKFTKLFLSIISISIQVYVEWISETAIDVRFTTCVKRAIPTLIKLLSPMLLVLSRFVVKAEKSRHVQDAGQCCALDILFSY